ncbi:MAG: hypothetical protein ABWK00_04375 [Desulfurococcaceae archaeon]
MMFSSCVVYATPSIDVEAISLKFLEDVVGFDMTNYHVVSFDASTVGLPGLPHHQTDIKVVIEDTTNKNRFEALIVLLDGKIWAYWLSGKFGDSNLSVWDHLKIASRSLASYKKLVGASEDFNRLIGMLLKAIEKKKQHIEDEGFALDIEHNELVIERSTYIYFARKVNDYRFSYFVMAISKDGLPTYIADHSMYRVATTINITREQAISKALPYAEAYARLHGQKIVAVNATLEFIRDLSGVRGDGFTIYPQWRVWITFDKVNEENVFAYAVWISADNGEVYRHGPQGLYCYGCNPPYSLHINAGSRVDDLSESPPWQLVATTVAVIIIVMPFLALLQVFHHRVHHALNPTQWRTSQRILVTKGEGKEVQS